jgi:hypothetical protein
MKSLAAVFFFLVSSAYSQQVLWQNDFSNQTDWIITDVNGAGGAWELTNNFSIYPYTPFNVLNFSNTGSFGFVNGGNLISDLTIASSISNNLGGNFPSNVFLQFENSYSGQFTRREIQISTDGINWTSFIITNSNGIFVQSNNPDVETFNISNIAGNASQLFIRFHFEGGQQNEFWAVDNIKLIIPELYDLKLKNVQIGTVGASGIKIPYYQLPPSQIGPIQVSGIAKNIGLNNQNNVLLTTNVPGTQFSSSSNNTNLLSLQSDTISISTDFLPPNQIGLYTLNTVVSGSSENNLSDNNIYGPTININNHIYSRDNGIVSDFLTSYSNGFEAGNIFDIFNPSSLKAINFYVHPQSIVGTPIYSKLYSIDPSTGDFLFIDESNQYTLTSADLGQSLTLPLMSGNIILNAGMSYLAVVGTPEGSTSLKLGRSGKSEPLSSFYFSNSNLSWYYTTITPMVRMVFCENNAVSQTININSCSVPYVSPTNQEYMESGVYNEIIKGLYGCDSIYLTINLSLNDTIINQTICNGDIFNLNGQQYSQPGQYSQALINQFGCDSVITLNLNVNYNDYISIIPNPAFGNAPLNVAFANQTPNLSNYNFTWYFGDGTSQQSNAPFLSHIYTQDGYTDVTVVAENLTNGCSSSQTFNDMIFVIGGVTCTHTATIIQSGPLTECVGDSILLSSNTDPTFTYQWNRNGIPVSGATNSSFYPYQSGSYTVTIYQNNCPVTSGGITLTFNALPAVPTINSNGTITPCTGGTITLTAPSGMNSYLWNLGATSSSISVSQSGNYFVTVTNSFGCERTSNLFPVNASNMAPPQVCIVGIDSLTNENRIVWEKPLTLGIDSFYVYKESNVSNVYTKIGATDYNDLAVFLDVNSNPAVQAYRYKISALDTCGVETNVGDFHKTIHLTINQGVGGAWNLIWSHYEGLNFGSYNIYRGTSLSNMALLTTIQSNLNSYSDLTPPSGAVYYQIEVVNPVNCDPTKILNYGVSKSNIVNNGQGSINEELISSLQIYPNPTNATLTLEVSTDLIGKTYFIMDFAGRIIQQGKINSFKEQLDLHGVSKGSYFLQVEGKAIQVIKQ